MPARVGDMDYNELSIMRWWLIFHNCPDDVLRTIDERLPLQRYGIIRRILFVENDFSIGEVLIEKFAQPFKHHFPAFARRLRRRLWINELLYRVDCEMLRRPSYKKDDVWSELRHALSDD